MLLYVVGRLRKGIASHNLMMMTVLCVDYMISILSLTVIQIRGRSHQSSVPITNIQPSVLPSLRFLIRTEAQGHDSKVCRTSARSKETVEEEEDDEQQQQQRSFGSEDDTGSGTCLYYRTHNWILINARPGKAWEFVSSDTFSQ